MHILFWIYLSIALLTLLWLAILWLERRADRFEASKPDPHDEVHGDVPKPPPASWRGK